MKFNMWVIMWLLQWLRWLWIKWPRIFRPSVFETFGNLKTNHYSLCNIILFCSKGREDVKPKESVNSITKITSPEIWSVRRGRGTGVERKVVINLSVRTLANMLFFPLDAKSTQLLLVLGAQAGCGNELQYLLCWEDTAGYPSPVSFSML